MPRNSSKDGPAPGGREAGIDRSLDFLDDLNPEQREAATYTGGPLLILAGAGSGKTRCLTYRFAYLVHRFDLDPASILAITFTNKAAREMRERTERLLLGGVAASAGAGGKRARPAGRSFRSGAGPLWVSTFHSACARLLRLYGEAVGLPPNFVIYDEDDQLSVMKRVIEEQGWDENRFPAQGFLAVISRAKDELVSPDEYAERAGDFREERTARAYELYQARLRANNAVDFDDLIFRTATLLRENEDVLGALRERFRHVLIDEYQDTNHAQYVFADLLAAGHRNLCVVGDDDQSIYRWRGADIRNVLEFEEDYPDAKVIRLERNYRSTKTILQAANGVIAHNERRKGKELWTENEAGAPVIYYLADDEREEAAFVAGEVLGGQKSRGLALRSFAVLYRTHAQSRAFEEVFMRRSIPYQIIGGVRFYERKEIKDVLAYLRVAHNPADEVSLERALAVPRRGLGPVMLARLRELGGELGRSRGGGRGAGDLYAAIRAVAGGEADIQGMGIKLRAELARFASLIEDLASKAQARSEAGAAGGVAEMVREVAEKSGMLEALKAEGTPEADSRIENIRELVTVAADYARSTEDPSLASFLENAALLAAIDVMKEGDDGVVLMTVHNAKGLEFPNVFVVGLEQGLFPHSRSFEEPGGLEEERRLCYVAMTRAMDRLYLTHARERTLYGFSRPGEPSLFLTEVPRDALFVASPVAHPEVVGWEEATSGGRLASLRAGKVRAEERARVRAESEADKATPTRAGSAPSSGRKETSTARFCPGERVVHPRWGEGTIVGMSRIGARAGSPGDLQLRVAFPGKGVQTFPASEVERRER